MNPKQQMLRSSAVVAFFNLLGGLTGILVETSIAANLGLSIRSDAFYAAYTIPYIITNLLTATGQFSLVPFFASLEKAEGKNELDRGFSYVANIIFLGLGGIAAVGVVASPWIIHGIAPGFSHQQDEIATQLSRWLFLVIVPAGLGEVLRSFLLSRHYFALSTASGFIRNVASITVIVLGFHRFGVFSIVIGYMGGYLLQLLILGVPILVLFPLRYSLTFHASGESFRKLRGAGTAQLTAAIAWQGVVIVERIIASFLPAGTLTALSYGFKIQGSITELFGGSVGTAALPALSRAVARNDHAEERETFRETLRISLVLLSPMAVFCLMLNQNIIRLFFQRGNFTPGATRLMAMVLFYYSLSLLPYAFIRILSFHMFARHEGGIFLRLAVFLYTLNIGFDLVFTAVLRLGAKGIPLGLLSSALVTSWLTYRRNLCELRRVLDRTLAVFSSKILASALICAAVVGAMHTEIPGPSSGLGDLAYLCLLCGVGSIAFLVSLIWTRALPKAWLETLSRQAAASGDATSSVG